MVGAGASGCVVSVLPLGCGSEGLVAGAMSDVDNVVVATGRVVDDDVLLCVDVAVVVAAGRAATLECELQPNRISGVKKTTTTLTSGVDRLNERRGAATLVLRSLAMGWASVAIRTGRRQYCRGLRVAIDVPPL